MKVEIPDKVEQEKTLFFTKIEEKARQAIEEQQKMIDLKVKLDQQKIDLEEEKKMLDA